MAAPLASTACSTAGGASAADAGSGEASTSSPVDAAGARDAASNCCHGDVCGLPPDPDGTCAGPSGPNLGTLFFDPADLSTRTGATAPELRVDGLSLGASTGSALTLRTYPELEAVVASVAYDGGSFVMTPATPLADRWYVASLATVPDGRSAIPPGAKDAHLGTYYARFRPGSAPVRRSVALCQKPGATRVVLEYSEPLDPDFATGGAMTVSDSGTGETCAYAVNGGAPPVSVAYFDCGASLYASGTLRVVASGAAHAPDGGAAAGVLDLDASTSDALVDTQARSEDLDFTAVTESSSCKVLYR